jgi:type II secretory ATPase GspE/PulE/Tfp pilus assembly ATPase PilB-like protein
MENSQLSPEQQRITTEAITILTQRLNGRPCPMCGQSLGWNAEATGLVVTPIGQESISLSQYFPSIVLTCKHCFHMSFHGLKMMGVVK